MEIKICTKCKRELNIDMFCKRTGSKDGKALFCKECMNKIGLEYRKLNSKRENERTREYKETHQIETKEYRKNYRINNLEKVKETNKNYRKNNVEKVKEINRNYRKNNLTRGTITENNRKARKKLLPHTLTATQWERIKQEFNNRCCYCNRELPLAQEHFLALSNSGEYTLNNILPSCQSCNSSKGNRDFFKWYTTYEYYDKKRQTHLLKFLNYSKQNNQQLAFTI